MPAVKHGLFITRRQCALFFDRVDTFDVDPNQAADLECGVVCLSLVHRKFRYDNRMTFVVCIFGLGWVYSDALTLVKP